MVILDESVSTVAGRSSLGVADAVTTEVTGLFDVSTRAGVVFSVAEVDNCRGAWSFNAQGLKTTRTAKLSKDKLQKTGCWEMFRRFETGGLVGLPEMTCTESVVDERAGLGGAVISGEAGRVTGFGQTHSCPSFFSNLTPVLRLMAAL